MSVFNVIKNAPKRSALVGLSAAALIAAPVVQQWEGRVYLPYKDVGGVWTVCDGYAGSDIDVTKTYTDLECDQLLVKEIKEKERGVDKYLVAPVPDKTKAAFISFTYNVGVEAFRKSTLLKLANSGDIKGACNQLPRWRFVKNVEYRGLLNRRLSEKALCLEGINQNPWWGV